MIPKDIKLIFLEWLEKQPRSKTHIRDVLTMKNYVYKPIEELYDLFKREHSNLT